MLLESKRVKNWINNTVLQYPSHLVANARADTAWHVPNTQAVSLNPMPALVILLLGSMMGGHHQDTMLSSMVHQQWGNLLSGFAVARCVTYIILFLRPPTSYFPSRPPSEIIAAFCLTGGGLIFMMSVSIMFHTYFLKKGVMFANSRIQTRNVVETLVYYNVEVMFTMTVGMALTAFIMACEILAVALKAWAVKREMPPQLAPYRFPA